MNSKVCFVWSITCKFVTSLGYAETLSGNDAAAPLLSVHTDEQLESKICLKLFTSCYVRKIMKKYEKIPTLYMVATRSGFSGNFRIHSENQWKISEFLF